MNERELSSAKEYEAKIIKQKKDSYKYRTSAKETSIDDKLKTKALLSNINLDKLFNRRSLLSPNQINIKRQYA